MPTKYENKGGIGLCEKINSSKFKDAEMIKYYKLYGDSLYNTSILEKDKHKLYLEKALEAYSCIQAIKEDDDYEKMIDIIKKDLENAIYR